MPIAIMTVVSVTVMTMMVPMVMMSFVSVTSAWGARARARIVISAGPVPMAMLAGRHCVDFLRWWSYQFSRFSRKVTTNLYEIRATIGREAARSCGSHAKLFWDMISRV
jgi:hypothetical protein